MKRPAGQLRIIGGQWRSRRVDFDAAQGVRPTPDRVRQTLFDWLAPWIEGARVLDLFAGSGALGLEALSRGAARVDFVEQGAVQCRDIRSAVQRLGASERASVHACDARAFLRDATGRYDIVFLDPPYDAGLLAPTLVQLAPRLAPVHRIYVEWRKGEPLPLPAGFQCLKEKVAGQVSYGLIALTEACA